MGILFNIIYKFGMVLGFRVDLVVCCKLVIWVLVKRVCDCGMRLIGEEFVFFFCMEVRVRRVISLFFNNLVFGFIVVIFLIFGCILSVCLSFVFCFFIVIELVWFVWFGLCE